MVAETEMKMLLSGGSGTLGKYFRVLNTFLYAPSRQEMDVTNRGQTFDVIRRFKPEVVIHAAAYTDVAGAEKNREECWRTNVAGTINMIDACKRLPVHFIYVSTACVFHGDRGNYTETDIPYPCNFYGLTKLMGEVLVRTVTAKQFRALIIRTNFVKRGPWPYPKAFVDRYGTYLYAEQVANKILHHVYEGTTGTLHICGEEKMSMFQIAQKESPEVLPLTLEEYYLANPNGPALTEDMTLKSVRNDIR